MIPAQVVFEITVLGFAGLAVAAAISDARTLTIPNRYCLAMAILFPAYVLTASHAVDWVGAAAIGSGLLAAGFLLFAGEVLGGGDAKLVAAVGLWAGPGLILDFLIITGIVGGTMALVLWLRHRLSRAVVPGLVFATESDPAFRKQPMPYAIAIAAGGLYVAFTLLGIG